MHTEFPGFISLCFLAAAQYSSQGSGAETLRVSLRVSGSGSEGRVRAKHHNTRDNGGFMPFASYERSQGQTEKQTKKEKLWENLLFSREDMKRFQIYETLMVDYILIASLLFLSCLCSLYCHFVCPARHMSAEPK